MGVGPLDTPSEVVNLGRVRDVPFLVASIVGALAVLSLGHQMIVAVRRRRRDFAILRALGVAPRWLTSVVHWQATMVTAESSSPSPSPPGSPPATSCSAPTSTASAPGRA